MNRTGSIATSDITMEHFPTHNLQSNHFTLYCAVENPMKIVPYSGQSSENALTDFQSLLSHQKGTEMVGLQAVSS